MSHKDWVFRFFLSAILDSCTLYVPHASIWPTILHLIILFLMEIETNKVVNHSSKRKKKSISKHQPCARWLNSQMSKKPILHYTHSSWVKKLHIHKYLLVNLEMKFFLRKSYIWRDCCAALTLIPLMKQVIQLVVHIMSWFIWYR
jgi:hypothetical protein